MVLGSVGSGVRFWWKASNKVGLLSTIFLSQIANSSQWCRDWYADKLPGGEVTNPVGPPSGSSRAFRGGGWSDFAEGCRSASRNGDVPGHRSKGVGFRLALAPSLPKWAMAHRQCSPAVAVG
jgi:hypothetical protein